MKKRKAEKNRDETSDGQYIHRIESIKIMREKGHEYRGISDQIRTSRLRWF